MKITEMKDGLRVRITKEIELFKIGVFHPGALGTVHVTGGDGNTAPYCIVEIDGHPPALERWGGLQVWSGTIWNVTADDFELVVVEE